MGVWLRPPQASVEIIFLFSEMGQSVWWLVCVALLVHGHGVEGRSLAEDRVEVLSPEGRLPQEMSDRIFVLQTLLLGQALNTKHPKPQEEEEEEMSQSYSAPIESGEYKLVRCFQIPESVRCYKSSAGVAGEASNRCETVMARQCYLYTYIIHSPQPVH